MADLSSMRVADDEREQLIDELREHAGAGRLTSEELEDRIDVAYRATTRADLEAVRADLPVSSRTVALELSRRKGRLRRRLAQEAGGAVGMSALAAGVWLLTGGHHHGDFWPAWVIGLTMLPVVRDSWRLFGPASDLETVEARLQRRHERRLVRGHHRHRYRGLPW
ncbi:MAG TPA: DUF1707 domain-containing protein [Solirubrobacteraceae bacterium]|jgi:hypothetical protein|nr:DUF1707 domain-containing protein [Solirubrobacteraceae bacterium]